uniref:DDE-1 domain-containing protein n=1 Tax=Amphimedon queenslandica TaxID=400682 RepID=A0A1X7TK98_AMPQE
MHRNFSSSNIFAMDETACWFDMPNDTTIHHTGARSVSLKTTGHEKDHFSVILTARADGTKLKPFVVFKGKGTRLIKELEKIPGIVVRFSSNGWMNDSLTIEYLRSIIGSLSFSKCLLVWDAYKCHTSTSTQSEASQVKLHTAIIPGGCTKFIQAADVSWNASFKSTLRSHYDTWLSEPSLHEFTKGGNMKAPSRSLLCKWVKSSWDAVSQATITKSFLIRAITTSIDGSDDDEIHCFKSGQPCADGQSLLQAETTQLLSEPPSSNTDPFASDIDSDEDEENEICIEEDDKEGGEENEDNAEADDSDLSDVMYNKD